MKKWLILNATGLSVLIISVFLNEAIYIMFAFGLLLIISIFSLVLGIIDIIKQKKYLILILTFIVISVEIVGYLYWIVSITASVGDW